MKVILSENQLKGVILEAMFKPKDLCDSFGQYSRFCTKVSDALKDGRTGGKEGNMIKISKEFFTDVLKKTDFFKKIVLKPDVTEYEERLEELKKFRDILKNHNSCARIVSDVEKDIDILPTKGLIMNIDDDEKYSLLNRLDTHYSAKGFLLTKKILDVFEKTKQNSEHEDLDLNKANDLEIRELLKNSMRNENVNSIASYFSNLLNSDEQFKLFLFKALEYSRESGNAVEKTVFNKLRSIYGDNNVFEFSQDFGFVDYFGADGVIVIDEVAHPIQISTNKKYPKIFQYVEPKTKNYNGCRPIGYYKEGKEVVKYEKEF
jgi:hypothetical protein